mmetsp:Transcript_17776/g.29718  ORF Transcript_17776/g.29718 Transcript_17776/m.29718 type:complete len:129 (+) Transcript_17776:84-470(+)|eukprot:CAMPEP_0114431722 /NCGR_PEP_ID=MMETSP0103-20121206/10761_1 /TAXON_ID=37642 ORGANISM="Paraphysomonas imperforata, Strain PA2" /NCGR_SAMPLE_ID=MMETSP0103 /ASSEMBLY_ACC=CAM_ASM_000201 /LENGTH=128 /DNA_ID=CAMNT_0001601325 /DNA_START=72 /DNA_END=458 /DNA_ORIENTATION=+
MATRDPKQKTLKYLNDKKVVQLFELLGARLAFAKPEDPNEFLKEELAKIQEKQAASEPVTLFTEEDLTNMFSIFDLTGRGYVTHVQYDKALSAVGIDPATAKFKPLVQAIDKAIFVKHLNKEIVSRAL